VLEELGDLLYQIEFHAVIAEQEGRFSMADVARGVHDKLVRRHPHVFGDVQADDADAVRANWEAIKQREKSRSSVFDGVAHSQPSLAYAEALQRKAAKLGFDWPDVHGALPKIAEEAAEIVAAVAAREVGGEDAGEVADEVGDLLFAVVNVARHLGIEPESALRAAAAKFRARFEGVEALARQRSIDLAAAGLDVLDALWDEVKRGA
jgi:MazG family protein